MEPVVLRAGGATATVFPDPGGRLGQLTVNGTSYLRGPENGAAHLGWGYWGSYPLLPWSNRIPGGRFRFEGKALSVPVSWEDGSALHGLAARVAWNVSSADAGSVSLTIDIDEGPYRVTGEQRFTLRPDVLEQRLGIVNRGERVPVGLGIHPWFKAAPVRVPADAIWPGEPMPTGAPVPVDAHGADLRARRIATAMDRCYTALTADAVEIGDLRLEWSGPIAHVVVFSGDPAYVCVEPVTMANDGFRLADEGVAGSGVIALAPGESTEVIYRFVWPQPLERP